MGDFTSEKEQKLLESEAEVSNTEDTNADELNFEEVSGFSDDDGDSEEEEKKPKKKFIGYDKQNKKFFIGKFKIGKKLLIIILVIAILAGVCTAYIWIDRVTAYRQTGLGHDVLCFRLINEDSIYYFCHDLCTSNTLLNSSGIS